jgi:hypothetical protein
VTTTYFFFPSASVAPVPVVICTCVRRSAISETFLKVAM